MKKNFRINVRANVNMVASLKTLKDILSITTHRKLSDSDIIELLLNYCCTGEKVRELEKNIETLLPKN